MPAALVVLAAVIIAGGGFVVAGNASKGGTTARECAGTMAVRLGVSPEMAPVLEQATAALEAKDADVDGVCIDFEVKGSAAAAVAQGIVSDPASAPHLWVPDSSVWLARAAASGATPATLAKSLGSSPLIVAGPEASPPASWLEVGKNTVAFLDPLTSSTGAAGLLAAFGEASVTGASKEETGAMVVPLAQRYGAQPNKPQEIADVVAAAEQGVRGLMTEQQLVALQEQGKGAGLKAAVPATGTLVLDFPLAALSPEEWVREAGGQLAVYMAGDRGAKILAENGFRDTRNSPLSSGKGLGKTAVTLLPAPEAAAVSSVLRQWAVLTMPSRSIAVFDVSGSMDFTDGGRTRISLATEAAGQALSLFPDNAQIGMWAFSVGLGGGTRDYLPLVPVRTLGATGAPKGQRAQLGAALRRLPTLTDGGTGLYDTTLAAVRTLQEGYDPAAVNSVILLTDGENEDPGSLSLQQLLTALERERDPARPVRVVAIGMGPEADIGALKRVAGVTGGSSYAARQPSDIAAVFRDALLGR